MKFGNALNYLEAGHKIARSGWNGKGMWLMLVPADSYAVIGTPPDVKRLPWIGMKTADNGFVPWLASQTDILADDWDAFDTGVKA